MKYRHIIWDWNGTLLNDRWLCLESINVLLSNRGTKTLSEGDYLDIFDFPVRDYYVKAGFDFSKEDFKIPALQFIELYDKKRKECKLQENALEVLNQIKKMGISQSLLSASEIVVLIDMVNHFGLTEYFQIVSGLDNHYAASKIDLGKELIRKIGISPAEILMVGDTCHDHEVSKALGLDVVLYDQGHFPSHRLVNCGCRVISNLLDLLNLKILI